MMLDSNSFRHFLLVALGWLAATPALLTAQPVPEEGDIRGPKPPVEIPAPEKLPLAMWLAIAGAALLLAIAWFLWKRRARNQYRKSPPQVALAELAELELNCGEMPAEAFANRAAQVVRQYIADRFGLAAPRRTTEEFLRDLSENSPLAVEGDTLRAFMKSCDLAKFAGSGIDAKDREKLLESARGFVAATTPAPGGKKP